MKSYVAQFEEPCTTFDSLHICPFKQTRILCVLWIPIRCAHCGMNGTLWGTDLYLAIDIHAQWGHVVLIACSRCTICIPIACSGIFLYIRKQPERHICNEKWVRVCISISNVCNARSLWLLRRLFNICCIMGWVFVDARRLGETKKAEETAHSVQCCRHIVLGLWTMVICLCGRW